MGEVERLAGGLADVLGPLLMQVPPNVGSHEPGGPVDTLAARLGAQGPRRAHCR